MNLAELLEFWSHLETSTVVECKKLCHLYFVKYDNQNLSINPVEEENDSSVWAHLQKAIQLAIAERGGFTFTSSYSSSSNDWQVDISACGSHYSATHKEMAIALLDVHVQILEELASKENEQYIFVNVLIQDGKRKYEEPCILVTENDDDTVEAAEALLSQYFKYPEGENLPTFTEDGVWSFPDDYQKIAAEPVTRLSVEEYTVLERFLTETYVAFPHCVIAGDEFYHLTEIKENGKRKSFYRNSKNPSQLYKPMEVYCHILGINVQENFPEFRFGTW